MAKAYYWNDKIWNNTSTSAGGWGMAIVNYRASGTPIVSTTGATLFPATFAAGDIIYFGTKPYYGKTFRNIYFDIGTAMAGTYTLAWEYYNGNTWTALTVTDNTTNFTTTGVNSVDFTPPTDWQMVDPSSQGTGYWVRCRIATCTVSTTNPVMTAGVYIKFGNNTFAFTGDTAGTDDVTFNDILVNAGGAPITCSTTDTTGFREYRLACHLSIGRTNVNGGAADNKKGYITDYNCAVTFENECRLMGYNTSSAQTFGRSWVANTSGYQGIHFRFNRYSYGATSTIRTEDSIYGTAKLYGCTITQLEDGTTPTTVSYNRYGLFIGTASNTSCEYLDVRAENLNYCDLQGTGASCYKKRISFYNCFQPQLGGGGVMDDIKTAGNYQYLGLYLQSAVDLTVTNLNASGNTTRTFVTWNFDNTCTLVNPSYTRVTNVSPHIIQWQNSDAGKILEAYTVNIHVQDENGTAIPSATVAMKPDSTAPVTTLEEGNNFSVSTNASGDITQQTLTSAKFVSSNPSGASTTTTISDYGPFIITVTKPGFKTMRLRKLSVLSATYGLKGLTLTVVLPRETLNLAPQVIQIT